MNHHHTPGPWEVWSGANTHCFEGVIRSPHSPNAIAFVHAKFSEVDSDVVSVEPSPDARLIAAAPDMLDALEEILPEIECRCGQAYTGRGLHESNSLCHHFKAVESAIAKAKGKEVSP